MESAPGFFGKIPSYGDFIIRRLPRQFVEPWDGWLQAGMASSREQLENRWLDTFLYSPVWQFALSPGQCGGNAWVGVMIPSVDRVGRYFPLTVAAKAGVWPMIEVFEAGCGWFERLADLALTVLEDDFNLSDFDDRLGQLRLADYLTDRKYEIGAGAVEILRGRQAFHFQLDVSETADDALFLLGNRYGCQFLERCSFWRNVSDQSAVTSLLVCEGLPPVDVFANLLQDDWSSRRSYVSELSLSQLRDNLTAPVPDSNVFSLVQTSPISHDNSFGVPKHSTHELYRSFGKDDWTYCSAGLSVVGMRRKLNEDAIIERNEVGVWAVADGMGGHSAGDVASQALVNALAELTLSDNLKRNSQQIQDSLQAVNHQLLQLAESRGGGQIIGSTIVVLLIIGSRFKYLWAGDSRLYRYRNGDFRQLTQDHSLSDDTDYGEGVSSMHQNIITRAVGADSVLEVDSGDGELAEGDLFILCSDGLIKELSDSEIAAFCIADSPSEIVERLVDEAESRGGRDNISVIAVSVNRQKL